MGPQDFITSIIRPACNALGLGGPPAEELLLGTALQETGLRNIRQDHGPALGYFQIQPTTHDDLWKNFLDAKGRQTLAEKAIDLLPPHVEPTSAALIPYPIYAAAICRLIYYRRPEPLPAAGDLEAQAAYYKAWYNGPGKATTAEYIANYQRVMGA